MLKNYIKIAWRNLVKEKGYTLINLCGLSISIAFVSLAVLYLRMELSFDQFHSKADQLYRVSRTTFNANGEVEERDPYLPLPLGPTLSAEYPQVKNWTRVTGGELLIKGGKELLQENGLRVDRRFLEMFDFPLVQGNASTALSGAYDVVISETLAAKLAPAGTDLIGTDIEINIEGTFKSFTITGIARDVPVNSSIQFDILMNLDQFLQSQQGLAWSQHWGVSFILTFVQIEAAEEVTYLEGQMPSFRKKFYPNHLRELMRRGLWQDSTKAPATYHLQKVTNIHTGEGFEESVDPERYYRLGGIALIVLVLGCFNFTLLSIGKAKRRALEIGMRKTFGALRQQVIVQFWSESILTGLTSMVIAILLIYMIIPLFNETVQASITFGDFLQPKNILTLFLVALTTGVLAGIYPAIILSSYRPIQTMQQGTETKRTSIFSRSLIAVQFAVSVFFIVMSIVFAKQLDFVKTKDLGVNVDGVIRISLRGLNNEAVTNFKDKLNSYSFVKGMTGIRSPFPIYANSTWDFEGNQYRAYQLDVDRDFMEFFKLKFTKGTDFPVSMPDTTNVIVINESMESAFKGTELVDQLLPGFRSRTIGVVKNFNFQTLENEIEPVIISINPMGRGGVIRPRTILLVKIDLVDVSRNIEIIEKEFKAFFPDALFAFTFMRDDLNLEYQEHERWSKVMISASLMTVFIASLGLIGFSTMFVNNKQKEIGIRKIMGSTSGQIFTNFTVRFLQLVLAGAVVAVPAGWYYGNEWLGSFAFRIELSWLFLVAGVGLSLLIAFVVVSFMLVNISRLNPIQILREK